VPEEKCEEKMNTFLSRCFYQSGAYDNPDSFLDLYQMMRAQEGNAPANRLYYMAIPPFLFLKVSKALANAGLVNCGDTVEGWSRAVIEKPFGHDRPSSDELVEQMAEVFSEDQTFRIDHYLGKEMVQNLMVLRFANLIFEPIWNRQYVDHVSITFKEDFGVEDRAGYFDQYGIVRDVMQNHLLQILALVAMEPPRQYRSREIRDAKTAVLKQLRVLTRDHIVLGQYEAATVKGQKRKGYLEEEDIPADSHTPTFAAGVFHIENERWKGVPFMMQAGKGMDTRLAEIRITFREMPRNVFPSQPEPFARNELVFRVQPDEAVYLNIVNKIPGQGMVLAERSLNLLYQSAFDQVIPEAYESLLLEVIRGDKSLFIRKDELAIAWDIFTPILHEIDQAPIHPEGYPYGSATIDGARRLAARHGIR